MVRLIALLAIALIMSLFYTVVIAHTRGRARNFVFFRAHRNRVYAGWGTDLPYTLWCRANPLLPYVRICSNRVHYYLSNEKRAIPY